MRSVLSSTPFAEEMETQKGEVTHLQSHNRVLELGLQSVAGAWGDFSERKLGREKGGWRTGVEAHEGWKTLGQSRTVGGRGAGEGMCQAHGLPEGPVFRAVGKATGPLTPPWKFAASPPSQDAHFPSTPPLLSHRHTRVSGPG